MQENEENMFFPATWTGINCSFLLKVVYVVEQCLADEQENILFKLFNDQPISDGVVQYLRLLTSAHLQNHADFFCNFVEAPDLRVYCRQVRNKVLLPFIDQPKHVCL